MLFKFVGKNGPESNIKMPIYGKGKSVNALEYNLYYISKILVMTKSNNFKWNFGEPQKACTYTLYVKVSIGVFHLEFVY